VTRFFLGVDGGQSSTTALIGDETGRVLGVGKGGPCNHVSGDEKRRKFIAVVGGCVAEAGAQAGLPAQGVLFDAAHFGFSGGPEDKQPLVEELFRANRLQVTGDMINALAGATCGKPGIVTIAGTGSIAFGRNASGRTARAGGWGYVFGDEGGAFDLARQALRAALRNEEGWGPPTVLRNKLLAATGAANANDLLHKCYAPEFPRDRVAKLALLVEEAAGESDRVAIDILQGASQQLAMLASMVRRQLFNEGDIVLTAYIGGVFRCATIRERFRSLVELEEGIQCIAPVMEPAAGALLEAYRLGGLDAIPTGVPEREKI
jgi:N-acetylglucosamine kinase-like BadF-type ATPase